MHWNNVVLMLVHRLRCCPITKRTLYSISHFGMCEVRAVLTTQRYLSAVKTDGWSGNFVKRTFGEFKHQHALSRPSRHYSCHQLFLNFRHGRRRVEKFWRQSRRRLLPEHHDQLKLYGMRDWWTADTQSTQNICITFLQCWIKGEDVGPTLYNMTG